MAEIVVFTGAKRHTPNTEMWKVPPGRPKNNEVRAAKQDLKRLGREPTASVAAEAGAKEKIMTQ